MLTKVINTVIQINSLSFRSNKSIDSVHSYLSEFFNHFIKKYIKTLCEHANIENSLKNYQFMLYFRLIKDNEVA